MPLELKVNVPAPVLVSARGLVVDSTPPSLITPVRVSDAEVPTLKGRVIKLEPAVKPKTILLAMEDKTNNTTTADATLKFEMPLPGKVDEGTELTFEGVADSYTASPFMVVFTLDDKDKLHGWTGKNEPAPVRRRPAAAH